MSGLAAAVKELVDLGVPAGEALKAAREEAAREAEEKRQACILEVTNNKKLSADDRAAALSALRQVDTADPGKRAFVVSYYGVALLLALLLALPLAYSHGTLDSRYRGTAGRYAWSGSYPARVANKCIVCKA